MVNVKLTLYAGEDDDLLAYFAAIPPRGRASAVKAAMRSGNIAEGVGPGSDEDEMFDALEGLLI